MNVLRLPRVYTDVYELGGRELTAAARSEGHDDRLEVVFDRQSGQWRLCRWMTKRMPDGILYRRLHKIAQLGASRPYPALVRRIVGATSLRRYASADKWIAEMERDRARGARAAARRVDDRLEDLADYLAPAVMRGAAGAEVNGKDIADAYNRRWV